MLQISLRTLSTLQEAQERGFFERLSKLLRGTIPSLKDEPEDALHNQLHSLAMQARDFGLSSERAIGIYAVTAALLGTDFSIRFPGAQSILLGQENGDRKAELLEFLTLHLFKTLGR